MKMETLDKKIAVLEEQVKSSKIGLELQAKEYERRLEILNHESERLKEMQSTYVRKESYEKDIEAVNVKISTLSKFIWVAVGIFTAIEIYFKVFLK